MLNVEQSRAERLERHAARLRDRGGIFVPAQRTGVLADILLGKRKLSPVKRRSRSRSLSCSPVRVTSPQRGQGSVKPIKKSDSSAKRKPRQSKAAKPKSTPKKRANAKSTTPSVVPTGDEQGEIKVVKKTQRAATKQTAKRTATKSSKTKTAPSSQKEKNKRNATAKGSNAKAASEPVPLSVILEEDESEFISTRAKTSGTTASVDARIGKPKTSHVDDQIPDTPSKPSRPRKKPPAPATAKGKGKAADLVKLEDEHLSTKAPTKSAPAKAKSKPSAVKVEEETVPKKATTKSATAARHSIASDEVDEEIVPSKRKKRPLVSDEDPFESKPVKRSRTKAVVKKVEEPKPTKTASKGRKRDRETDEQDSQDQVSAPKRRRTKVEKGEVEPVKKAKAKSTRDAAASKVKTVSKNKKENGTTLAAGRARKVASKPVAKQKPRGPPQVILDRLKNAMPQIADDEPDEIDFLS